MDERRGDIVDPRRSALSRVDAHAYVPVGLDCALLGVHLRWSGSRCRGVGESATASTNARRPLVFLTSTADPWRLFEDIDGNRSLHAFSMPQQSRRAPSYSAAPI